MNGKVTASISNTTRAPHPHLSIRPLPQHLAPLVQQLAPEHERVLRDGNTLLQGLLGAIAEIINVTQPLHEKKERERERQRKTPRQREKRETTPSVLL